MHRFGGAAAAARPTSPRSTTRSRRRAPARGDLPLPAPRRARSPTSPTCASARSRSLDARPGDGRCTSWCCATSTSTTRRCCRRSSSRACRRARASPRRPRPRRRRRYTGLELRRGPGRPVHARRRRRRLRLRQRAPAPRRRLPRFRIGRTPITNATFLRFVEGGGYERREWWSRRGAGRGRSSTTSPTPALDGGPDGWRSGAWTAGRRSTRTSPSSTSPGSRPTPSPARTALASPPRRSGRRRRPGTRSDGTRAGTRGATSPAPRRRRANLDQRALRHRAGRRATRRAPRPCGALGMLGDVWEWTASDFDGYPGFGAHPYREYSEVFFGGDYQVLRGGSWATRAPRRHADVPQLGPPAAPADLLRAAAGEGRVSDRRIRARHRIDATSARAHERALADDVLDGLTRPFKELPPKHFYDARGSELFDRDLRAARVLPDAHRARDPRGAGRRDRRRDGRRGAGRARLRLRGQDARAARRDGARRTLRRYVPFDVSESVVRDCAERAGRRVPGPARARRRRRLRAPPRPRSRRRARPPAHRRVPRRHDRQLPARQPAALPARDSPRCSAPTTGCCSAPTSSRTSTCSRPPTTTAPGVTAEFNRNVLHVINRELERRLRRSTRFEHVAFFDRRARVDRDAPARPARLPRCAIAALDLEVEFAARRGDPHRDLAPSSRRERLEADYARRGAAAGATGTPIPTGCSRCRWLSVRRARPRRRSRSARRSRRRASGRRRRRAR